MLTVFFNSQQRSSILSARAQSKAIQRVQMTYCIPGILYDTIERLAARARH